MENPHVNPPLLSLAEASSTARAGTSNAGDNQSFDLSDGSTATKRDHAYSDWGLETQEYQQALNFRVQFDMPHGNVIQLEASKKEELDRLEAHWKERLARIEVQRDEYWDRLRIVQHQLVSLRSNAGNQIQERDAKVFALHNKIRELEETLSVYREAVRQQGYQTCSLQQISGYPSSMARRWPSNHFTTIPSASLTSPSGSIPFIPNARALDFGLSSFERQAGGPAYSAAGLKSPKTPAGKGKKRASPVFGPYKKPRPIVLVDGEKTPPHSTSPFQAAADSPLLETRYSRTDQGRASPTNKDEEPADEEGPKTPEN